MDKNVYSSEVKWGVVTDELSDDLKMKDIVKLNKQTKHWNRYLKIKTLL